MSKDGFTIRKVNSGGSFFGSAQRQQFGYMQAARRPDSCTSATLICPPIGHEYFRTHWAIRRLATTLSRNNTHVFRFDYCGVGDSVGDFCNVNSIEELMHDAVAAATELVALTGIQKINVIGLRTGANIASALPTCCDVENLILWEPRLSADQYVEQWRGMHRPMIDLWMTKLATEDSRSFEEILGTRFSRSFLNELESFEFGNRDDLDCENLTVIASVSKSSSVEADWKTHGYELVNVEDQSDWSQLKNIEIAWLPNEGPLAIAKKLKNPSLLSSQANDRGNLETEMMVAQ